MQLTDDGIRITGGTSGIGRALAEALHQRGDRAIIAGRRQQLIDQIVALHPGMQGLQVDMADSSAVDTFAVGVRERFPDLNALINNASITQAEDLTITDIDVSVARSIIETNIVGVLQLTAASLPTLRRQSRATILTMTPGLAFVPRTEYPTYSASKAFLHPWLQSMRSQLRGTVEVLELSPPYVQTELGGSWQATDPNAIALADNVTEVMQALEAPAPSRGEILVERLKTLRWAATNGVYEKMFDALNGS